MGAQVKLIREDSLRVSEEGFSFDVRLNWYRSLPLSSVELKLVKINDVQIPLDQVLFEINEHQYTPNQLIDQYEELWFVQDFATLRVAKPDLVNVGEKVELETEISLRFPYMSIGPGKYLTIPTKFASTQTAAQGGE